MNNEMGHHFFAGSGNLFAISFPTTKRLFKNRRNRCTTRKTRINGRVSFSKRVSFASSTSRIRLTSLINTASCATFCASLFPPPTRKKVPKQKKRKKKKKKENREIIPTKYFLKNFRAGHHCR